MKEEKKKSKVVLIRDKLFVSNELVVPDEATHLEPRRSTTRLNKRTRVNSTPERDDTPAQDNRGRQNNCTVNKIDTELFAVNHCSLDITVINIHTINVCGLKRRIQSPEILELVI